METSGEWTDVLRLICANDPFIVRFLIDSSTRGWPTSATQKRGTACGRGATCLSHATQYYVCMAGRRTPGEVMCRAGHRRFVVVIVVCHTPYSHSHFYSGGRLTRHSSTDYLPYCLGTVLSSGAIRYFLLSPTRKGTRPWLLPIALAGFLAAATATFVVLGGPGSGGGAGCSSVLLGGQLSCAASLSGLLGSSPVVSGGSFPASAGSFSGGASSTGTASSTRTASPAGADCRFGRPRGRFGLSAGRASGALELSADSAISGFAFGFRPLFFFGGASSIAGMMGILSSSSVESMQTRLASCLAPCLFKSGASSSTSEPRLLFRAALRGGGSLESP